MHSIKKVVFELQVGSPEEANALDKEFREVLAAVVLPLLEQYMDSIQKSGTVTRIDKLTLDVGVIRAGAVREDVGHRLTQYFSKQNHPLKITETSHTVAQKLSDLEAFLYFLKMGMFPWQVSTGDAARQTSTRIRDLIRNNHHAAQVIIQLVRHSPTRLKRLALYADDDMLWELVISYFTAPSTRLLVEQLSSLWKQLKRNMSLQERIVFWTGMFNNVTKQTIDRDLLHEFLLLASFTKKLPIATMFKELADEADRQHEDFDDREAIKALIEAYRKEAREALPIVNMEYVFYNVWDELERNQEEKISPYEWIQGLHLGLMETLLRHIPALYQLPQLRTVLLTLEQVVIYLNLPKLKSRIRLLKEMLPEQSTDTPNIIEQFLAHMRNSSHASRWQADPVVRTIQDLLQYSHALTTPQEFMFFLNRVEQVIDALPQSELYNELAHQLTLLEQELIRQWKKKQVATELLSLLQEVRQQKLSKDRKEEQDIHTVLKHLHNMLQAVAGSLPFGSMNRQGMDDIIEETGRLISRGFDDPYQYKKNIHDKIKALAGISKDHEEEPVITGDDIYISNAGLVLLAPFIQQWFQQEEMITEGQLTGEQSLVRALACFHYLTHPDTDAWHEYEMPLTKLLCGLGITTVVPSLSAGEESNAAGVLANNILEDVLSNADVFKNISPEGFRNAFLKREGVLQVFKDHAVLKVSRETFDIVLEKVPWSYHTIRFPWMNIPLIVEW